MTRAAVAFLCLLAVVSGVQAQNGPPPQKILETMTDTVGAPIRYPAGEARVSSYLLTMVPGQSTGWHRHDVPLYARMLAGSISVDYGDGVTKTYRAGDTFMESMGRWHNGQVVGDDEAKLLIVFIGATGVPNTEIKP